MSDQPNEQKSEERPTAPARRLPSLHPFRLFGYLLGAVSVIGLVEDLDLIKLYGQLELWLAAYERLVTLLFGWIDLWWIGLSLADSYVAVIGLLYWSAVARVVTGRAKALGDELDNEHPTWALVSAGWLYVVGIWAATTLLPLLLIPGAVGLTLGFLVPFFCIWWTIGTALDDRTPEDERNTSRQLCYEMLIVVAAAGFIIALNYAVFRAIAGG